MVGAKGSEVVSEVVPEGFYTTLKARRMELGFTLRDVEQITGGQISNAYLSQLENGKIKNPSFVIICALAATYHVSIETMRDWLSIPVQPPALCPTCGQAVLSPPTRKDHHDPQG
jgi:transcriptional regulator with XRE-family HTH domain